jgi:hypothetical protein
LPSRSSSRRRSSLWIHLEASLEIAFQIQLQRAVPASGSSSRPASRLPT